MNPEMTQNGLRLEQQVTEIRQLLAAVQVELDELQATAAAAVTAGDAAAASGATASALATAAANTSTSLSRRRAALDATVEALRLGQGEIERHLQADAAELASREAALEASREQLRALTRRLVQVQEDERRSLSRDLHDTSGQAMTILGLGLSMLAREAGCSEKSRSRIADLRRMAETVGEDLHRLSVNLRPSSLDRYGLVPALDELVRTMRKQTGVDVELSVEGLEERLPADTESALYRIVQEACTNIVRYAGATHAVVSIRREGDTVQARVEDDGQGFDVEEALSRGRLGLLGMRERAEMLGGTFAIDSRSGQGTTIDVQVPSSSVLHDDARAGAARALLVEDAGQLTAREDVAIDPSVAAELVRAKTLSDALVDLVAEMTGSASAEEALSVAVARSAEAFGCDSAAVLTREDGYWRFGPSYPVPLAGERVSDAESPGCMWVERTKRVLVVNDALHDPVIAPEYTQDYGVKSMAIVPLLDGDRVHGALTYVYHSTATRFTPSEVAFLERLAALVSLATQNIQLREIETRQRNVLEAVFATVPVGLAVVAGSDFRLKLANAAYRALTPHPERDPAGHPYAYIWPPAEGFDRGESWLRGVVETGEPLDVEHHKRIFPDGSERYFTFHARRLSWDDEPAALVVLMNTTVTEQATAQARQFAVELDTILSSINDGLIVYGPEGQLLRMNGAARTILGYSHPPSDVPFTERVKSIQPKKPDGEPYPYAELPAIRALRGERVQGTIMALEQAAGITWVSASAAPLYAPDGALRGAVSTFTDITALQMANRNLEVMSEELGVANEQLRSQARELAHLNATLAEERDRLKVLLESIPDEVWFCDAAGNVTAANPAALRGVGAPATGEAFQPFPDWNRLEVLDPDGRPRPLERAPLLRTLAGEHVRAQEEIVRNLETGEWRHREASGEAIRDNSGQITGAVLVVRDITDQTHAQQALRSNQAIYRAIAQSYPNGGIYVFDHDLRYLVVEGEALSAFGHTREGMEGKTIWEALDPETVSIIEPRYRRTLAGESLHFETMHGIQYGSRFVSADYRPIIGEGGQVVAGLLVAQDITERERLLAELQAAIAQLAGILNALPSGLIVYSPDSHTVRINELAQEMLGYDPDEWKRPLEERFINLVQLSRPDGTSYAREEYPALRALRGEEVHNEDVFIHLPRHPEKDFWALLSACPIQGDDGRLLGAVATITDTTELHRVGEQLTQANAVLLKQAQELRDAAELLEGRVEARTAELALKTERLGFLHEIDRAILAKASPAEIAEAALQIIQGSTRLLRAAVVLFDRAGGALEVLAAVGVTGVRFAPGSRAPLAVYPLIEEVLSGKIGTVEDVRDVPDSIPWKQLALSAGIKAISMAPLCIGEQVIGALTLSRAETGPLSADTLELMTHLSDSLAIAIHNARLLEEVRVNGEQLQALSRRLVDLQENERGYVADQLYNQATQVLAALKMQLLALDRSQGQEAFDPQLREMKAALDTTISALHALASHLRPAALDRASMADLLHDYVSRYVQGYGIALRFDAGDAGSLHLPAAVTTAVFRTVQEAIANVAQHAQATEVALAISSDAAALTVYLADNGVGFDAAASNRKGVGLFAMRERVESVGGRLTVKSNPRGTAVLIHVPLGGDELNRTI